MKRKLTPSSMPPPPRPGDSPETVARLQATRKAWDAEMEREENKKREKRLLIRTAIISAATGALITRLILL